MALLAVASLALVPELIRAEGQSGWGSIAVGQAIGTVAAVVLGLGWQISGPAVVATSRPVESLRELEESVTVKGLLLVPLAALAAGVAFLAGGAHPGLAAAGAVSTTSFGLTARWFFIGRAQPFVMLALETIPRVAGTVVGIVLMRAGAGGLVGLVSQFGGMLAAATLSCAWIIVRGRRLDRLPRRSVVATVRRQSTGLVASLTSATYAGAPVLIVSAVAPRIQPAYALVDKVQRQIGIALGPFTSVLQGWVPRGGIGVRHRRARQALALSTLFAMVIGLGVMLGGRLLVAWLGGGIIEVSGEVYALMGSYVGLVVLESALATAILPALGRIDMVSRATWTGVLTGLPLIALGARVSIEAALLGLLAGMLVRAALEVATVLRASRPEPRPEAHPANQGSGVSDQRDLF